MGESSNPSGGGNAQRGHLDRLARWLLIGGLVALGLSTVLTWSQVEGDRGGAGPLSIESTLAFSLVIQVLAVLAGALLTGAAFAYVMRAVRLDQQNPPQQSDSTESMNWHE